MYQYTTCGLLALAASAAAAGTPVLAERASSTVTPVTVTGNGMFLLGFVVRMDADNYTAFFQGTDRFYIRGVDYQPGTPYFVPSVISILLIFHQAEELEKSQTQSQIRRVVNETSHTLLN